MLNEAKNKKKLRIALLVPHIFMWDKIDTIFAPKYLALDLAEGLRRLGHEVTLFTPGKIHTKVENETVDLKVFSKEVKSITKKSIKAGGVSELLKKKPLTFITLARQIQNELVAKCYEMANEGEFDIIHVYTNEEETAMSFAKFVKCPVVFTHHEPFNFLARYRTNFARYKNLKFISISKSQQKTAKGVNFIGNVYHGIDPMRFELNTEPKDYFAYIGRIIKPKGVHLAIQACLDTGSKLKIAGKHYSGHGGDQYWEKKIKPFIDGKQIEYIGYINNDKDKSKFLGNAKALLMPVEWSEPFGMVMLEAMSCGTPVIGFGNGSIPEVVSEKKTGFVIKNLTQMKKRMFQIDALDRREVREYVVEKFSLEKMTSQYLAIYTTLLGGQISDSKNRVALSDNP
jgi:glycosyltransferase involved in cell wall biosynthesis